MKVAIKSIQHDSYNRLNDDFQKYITASAENSDLRISDLVDMQVDVYQEKYNIKERQTATKELRYFGMLFSLWEHAYLERQRTWMTSAQWLGWHQWFEEYLRKDYVRDAWMISARTFDVNFLYYVADYIIRPLLGLELHDKIPTDMCGPFPEGIDATTRHKKKKLPVKPPVEYTITPINIHKEAL